MPAPLIMRVPAPQHNGPSLLIISYTVMLTLLGGVLTPPSPLSSKVTMMISSSPSYMLLLFCEGAVACDVSLNNYNESSYAQTEEYLKDKRRSKDDDTLCVSYFILNSSQKNGAPTHREQLPLRELFEFPTLLLGGGDNEAIGNMSSSSSSGSLEWFYHNNNNNNKSTSSLFVQFEDGTAPQHLPPNTFGTGVEFSNSERDGDNENRFPSLALVDIGETSLDLGAATANGKQPATLTFYLRASPTTQGYVFGILQSGAESSMSILKHLDDIAASVLSSPSEVNVDGPAILGALFLDGIHGKLYWITKPDAGQSQVLRTILQPNAPLSLFDDQWHFISLIISSSSIQLFVDDQTSYRDRAFRRCLLDGGQDNSPRAISTSISETQSNQTGLFQQLQQNGIIVFGHQHNAFSSPSSSSLALSVFQIHSNTALSAGQLRAMYLSSRFSQQSNMGFLLLGILGVVAGLAFAVLSAVQFTRENGEQQYPGKKHGDGNPKDSSEDIKKEDQQPPRRSLPFPLSEELLDRQQENDADDGEDKEVKEEDATHENLPPTEINAIRAAIATTTKSGKNSRKREPSTYKKMSNLDFLKKSLGKTKKSERAIQALRSINVSSTSTQSRSSVGAAKLSSMLASIVTLALIPLQSLALYLAAFTWPAMFVDVMGFLAFLNFDLLFPSGVPYWITPLLQLIIMTFLLIYFVRHM